MTKAGMPILKKLNNFLFDKKQYLFWFFLFGLSLALHAKHLFNSDEGIVLEGAWNLFNGKEIYKDFFELTPPGAYYLIFFIWNIFGVSYWTAKIIFVISLCLSSFGIFKIWEALSPNKEKKWLIYLSLIFFIFSTGYWPIISYYTLNLLFIIWAAYFCLSGLQTEKAKYFFYSGILSALAVFSLHNRAIFFIISVSFFIFGLAIKQKKISLIKLSAFYSSSCILFSIFLFSFWPIKLLYEDLIKFPILNYTETASVSYFLLISFIAFFLILLLLLRKSIEKKLLLLFSIQFFLLLSSYSLADHYHIINSIFALYIILPILLEQYKKNLIVIALSGSLILIVIAPSAISFNFSDYNLKLENQPFKKLIKNHCADSDFIYAGPFLPGIYFEARKLNPSRYSWLITNHHTKEQLDEAVYNIKKNNPSCAILNYNMVKKYKYDFNNPVDNYIFSNYTLTYRENNLYFFKKNVN